MALVGEHRGDSPERLPAVPQLYHARQGRRLSVVDNELASFGTPPEWRGPIREPPFFGLTTTASSKTQANHGSLVLEDGPEHLPDEATRRIIGIISQVPGLGCRGREHVAALPPDFGQKLFLEH